MSNINFKVLYDLNSPSREKMENAFNIIYKEYSYLVFYVSLQIVKDNDIAKDITNETFCFIPVDKSPTLTSLNESIPNFLNNSFFLFSTYSLSKLR